MVAKYSVHIVTYGRFPKKIKLQKLQQESSHSVHGGASEFQFGFATQDEVEARGPTQATFAAFCFSPGLDHHRACSLDLPRKELDGSDHQSIRA